MYDYKIGMKVQGQSNFMGHYDVLTVGKIVDIKIDDGTTYYVVDSGNKNINWFTSEELQETEWWMYAVYLMDVVVVK